MIEAWEIEDRRWLYFFLRRFELCRWTLRAKQFHPEARWFARLRALWLALTGYKTERCCFCGGKVGVVWWCDDEVLWETVTGYEGGGGISCVQCFADRAEGKRIYLKWHVGPLSAYTKEEWLRIVNTNARRYFDEKASTMKQEHGPLPAEAGRTQEAGKSKAR